MEIHFSIKTKYGNYNDTLFFPDGANPTEDEIKQLKEERVRKWVRNFYDGGSEVEISPVSIAELRNRVKQKFPMNRGPAK